LNSREYHLEVSRRFWFVKRPSPDAIPAIGTRPASVITRDTGKPAATRAEAAA
jgi:hypothetical protein